MAEIKDINVEWEGHSGTEVQRFIKNQLKSKMGVFYYDATNNRYLVFASEDDKNSYVLDPTQTGLVLGTFDAPFNYTAELNLISASYNAVFLNSTGNYIDFTFDIKNKQGASTGENVVVTYTFMRNAVKQTFTQIHKFGDSVHFNIDQYLGEGTNTIMVSIVGQTTLAATSAVITYQVVNLSLVDEMDISTAYDLTKGSATLSVPFTVSGYGTKVVEWYLDGELLPFVKNEDEVVDITASRTKYITLSNLSQGRHSLQIRAYTTVNGERFYTDTLYRDVMVYTGVSSQLIIAVAVTIPLQYGILGINDSVTLYGVTQYIPYNLRFATYSPLNIDSSEVIIKLDNIVRGTVSSSNGIENVYSFMSTTSGDKMLQIVASDISYDIPVSVQPTSMNIEEITTSLALDFNALGKSNNSTDKDRWFYKDYTGILQGFNWNNTSGWVNDRLEINAGASFSIDFAPLANNPTENGRTIEIEWSTKNVSDDNEIICDLRGDDGTGILITATKVLLVSANGVKVETEYKADENVRIGFVINRATGTAEKGLSYIYANGIVSRCEAWTSVDSYTSSKEIMFKGSDKAQVSLKYIRVYNMALSAGNMLNNYILYRDSVAEMMEIYERNDVYESGTSVFSTEKMASRLPVMIVTGDIPVLENTSDKDTQIVVDVEFIHMQDSTRSFKMEKVAMRPQGTSSMGYPKKNFRIYTTKLDDSIIYDYEGNVIEDKLYSFKQGSQPVDCWCLKADYAESSGTHNTGIARMWNKALYDAQIDGVHRLRTNAQEAAISANYPYDVRTTIDGYPILLFYKPSVNDEPIFIGKYNFNNDKSTESVFGFTGIPNFDNTRMQCWEVLNNGNPLALFTTTEGFDEGWKEAFESRYPDTKTPETADLKAFSQWMVNVSAEDFKTQKWEHLDVYKMAGYYVYINRYAAVDQTVKNSMFTSEDGMKWYFILYDNDTINGLINTGRLVAPPTVTRQTKDESGEYYFAGHDSRLWNMLEGDSEFMQIVSAVDNALYSAGISYTNTIKMFDQEQADKWVERVYNQDAQYKYIGPYTEKGVNNLFMLQGKRDLHRKWWLAKRFAIYDAKYVSGTYKSQAVEIKCINNTPAGQEFTVTAGYPIDYGYGINNVPRSFGIPLEIGQSHTFSTSEVVNLGDPIRIYGASNIAGLDFSEMASRLAVVTISNVYDEANGTKLTKLILGKNGVANYEVTDISGLKQAIALEELDIQGMTKLTSLDLTSHNYIKSVKAYGSSIASIQFAKGAPVELLELPTSMAVLKLEQLPYLSSNNIKFETLANVRSMTVKSCPNISKDFNFVWDWINAKTVSDANCILDMDNINWSGVSGAQMVRIASLSNITLKGKVVLTDITKEQGAIITSKLGDTVFTEGADFYIDAPSTITLTSGPSMLEGSTMQVSAEVYPPLEGTMKFTLPTTRQGASINATTGLLTVAETGNATSNIVVRATFTREDGEPALIANNTIQVIKRVYPANATINGSTNPIVDIEYNWSTTTSGITGEYKVEWTLSGDIAEYYEIADSDAQGCSLRMTFMPLGEVNGTLTLTIKKNYNNEVVLTTTKALSALNADVIITSRSNAPIQISLFNAGLVANETYTLKSEAEKITGTQLQSGTTGDTTIFASQKNNITSFNEFKYFTKLTTVPQGLFYGFDKLQSIVIPSTTTILDDDVFYDCSSLSSVVLPEGLRTIEIDCFRNCSSLAALDMPDTITRIGGMAFSYCTALKSVILPKGLTSILSQVFQYCSALETLVIQEGITQIYASCFRGCTSLKNVSLPNTLVTISGTAFLNCTSLKNISIPESVSNISTTAFQGIHELDITVDANNATYSSIDGVLFNKKKTRIVNFCKGKKLPSYTIPSGVATIGTDAFRVQTSLTSIVIPSSVSTIEATAFSGCTYLTSIQSLAISAPSVSSDSFGTSTSSYTGYKKKGSNKLYVPLNGIGYESSYWLDPLQSADKCGFSIHGKLVVESNRSEAQFNIKYTTTSGTSKTVTVGVGTSYLNDIKYGTSLIATPIIAGNEVWDNSSVTITYNETNYTVSNNAYIYPKDATIVGALNPVENPTYTWTTTTSGVDGALTAEWSLSGSITSCIKIQSQDVNSCTMQVTEAPTEVVSGTLTLKLKRTNGIVLVTATKTLNALLEGIVITLTSNAPVQRSLYNAGLVANEKYSLKDEVEKITSSQIKPTSGYNTSIFYAERKNITHFDEFVYFTGLTTLDGYTFYECPFTSIVLPDNLTTLKSDAFAKCTELSSVFISKGITSIDRTFLEQHKLDFYVDDANTAFSAQDGVLFNKDKTTLVSFRKDSKQSSYEIPSTVEKIHEYAFFDCSGITSLTVPEGVTTLGEYCFHNCNFSSNSIKLPSTIKYIYARAFSGCKNLINTDFLINCKITYIRSYLFTGCSALTTATIPATVTNIEDNVFNMCRKLTVINALPMVAPKVDDEAFGYNSSSYIGTSGDDYLKIPLGATGYEESYWGSILLNPNGCGFSIYGKFVINSNYNGFKVNLSYVDDANVNKTVSIGVGTSYIPDIKNNSSFTLTVTSPGDYEWTTKTMTFVAGTIVEVSNERATPVTTIRINQTITDPATMITSVEDNGHIELLRSMSHRYLGKYTSEGTMSVCQLDDTNSDYYAYGGAKAYFADTSGTDGDLFVWIPKFYYRIKKVQTDIYDISFYVGEETMGTGWNVWEGDTLIGVKESVVSDSKLRSWDINLGSTKYTIDQIYEFSKNRGEHFSIAAFEHYNMIALLFFAQYKHTDAASILGVGASLTSVVGSTYDLGMTDSNAATLPSGKRTNFWGIESWVNGKNEIVRQRVNVSRENSGGAGHINISYTGLDGTTKSTRYSYPENGNFVKKISFENNFLPLEMNASSSTGYCSYAYWHRFGENVCICRMVNNGNINPFSYRYNDDTSSTAHTRARLTFTGNIVKVEHPDTFKALTAIG